MALSIESTKAQLKNQLQSLYAEKSVLEDKIFELKAQTLGFEACLSLQEAIAAQEVEAKPKKEK